MNFQPTNRLLMIRPYRFGYNADTAADNRFQQQPMPEERVAEQALQEFDTFVHHLRSEGLEVLVLQDDDQPPTPDSLFPNNWISFHENGKAWLYPMFAPSRRAERKTIFLTQLRAMLGLEIIEDFSSYEKASQFLEGTGSMVLDRVNRVAYACISERTHEPLFRQWCILENYQPVCFRAADESGKAIYHTNVMMSVAMEYAIVCLESIIDEEERVFVEQQLKNTGKEIISIDFTQLRHFAANVLQVSSNKKEPLLVMSEQAYQSFSKTQLAKIEHYNRIVKSPLYTIERIGGGGTRCMMAEVFA